MNSPIQKFKVTIFGESYTIVSDEPEEKVVRAAQLVDHLMRTIASQTVLADQKKIAVLAALQGIEEVLRLESQLEGYRKSHNLLIDRIDQELSGLSVRT